MGDQRLANDISLEDAGVKNGCALKMKVRASEAAFASQLEELVRERTALATSEIELLCQVSFILPLIYRIERNCKVAREANATIFITELPASHQTPHLQGLQKAVAETLQAMRKDEPSIDSASIDGDVVNVQVEGSYTICLRLAAA